MASAPGPGCRGRLARGLRRPRATNNLITTVLLLGQPRAAHAAERRAGLRPAPRAARGGPARPRERRADPEGRPPPALAHQRGARPRAHRVGPPGALAP